MAHGPAAIERPPSSDSGIPSPTGEVAARGGDVPGRHINGVLASPLSQSESE